jgi:hypothetical protein
MPVRTVVAGDDWDPKKVLAFLGLAAALGSVGYKVSRVVTPGLWDVLGVALALAAFFGRT